MRLFLDHITRLQLTVLLGNLDGLKTVGELRPVWKLMDLIELDHAEKHTLNLQVQTFQGGAEAYTWDQSKSIPVREFTLDDAQVKLLVRAITACPKFIPVQARRWLEPLLEQIPELEETTNANGTATGSIANSPR